VGRGALYLDALSSFWREWVINYDPAHQLSLAVNLSHRGQVHWFDLQEWAREKYDAMLNAAREAQMDATQSPREWIAATILIFILIGILIGLARYGSTLARTIRGWRKVARAQQAPSDAAAIWYGRMIRSVKRRGLNKEPEQTPQEFVTCIADENLRDQIARFTAHYEAARFGESVDDVLRLPELYAEIAHKG
jgi:hypothetical protein